MSAGVEALAGYGAGSRLEFLLVPLAYGVGGPVGIVISANLGAGQIDRAISASWIGVLMAGALTEVIGLAAADAGPMECDRRDDPRRGNLAGIGFFGSGKGSTTPRPILRGGVVAARRRSTMRRNAHRC